MIGNYHNNYLIIIIISLMISGGRGKIQNTF